MNYSALVTAISDYTENTFSTVSIDKPHVLHSLSLAGPPFFLRNDDQDEDLDKTRELIVMELFRDLEMVQSKELPCAINQPEVPFAANTPAKAMTFFTVPRPALSFMLYRH